jgi:thiamine pyrophosphokinase
MSTSVAIIAIAGDAARPDKPLPQADAVIAADGGLLLAEAMGLAVDAVVGDMDSVDPDRLAAAGTAGASIESHPADKDATDLDLALEAARARGAGRVIVIGGTGLDRIDHILANALVLTAGRNADLAPEWWVGAMRAIPVRGRVALEGSPGDLVTILPMAGPATVTTEGLLWPLDHEVLPFGSSRGVSNEVIAATFAVEVSPGVALVIHTEGPA